MFSDGLVHGHPNLAIQNKADGQIERTMITLSVGFRIWFKPDSGFRTESENQYKSCSRLNFHRSRDSDGWTDVVFVVFNNKWILFPIISPKDAISYTFTFTFRRNPSRQGHDLKLDTLECHFLRRP